MVFLVRIGFQENHLEVIFFVCGVVDDMVVLLCYEVFVVLNFSLG